MHCRWLAARHDVRLFAYRCDFDDVAHREVQHLRDVAFDPFFQASDVVVFHFGVYYPLFDLLPVAPTNAGRVVVFHNVTPKEFVAASHHDTIDRSHRQMANIAFADHVLCVSRTNLETLRSAGIDVPATVVPLSVEVASALPPVKASASDGVVRIAYVGRFVRSKGPGDLLAAVEAVAADDADVRLRLDLIGNGDFSDPAMIEALRATIVDLAARYGARLRIALHADAPEDRKKSILRDADLFVLPSYHEGFCVPILEALAYGCRVVTYDNSNLPNICGGLATLVPTGDVPALSRAIAREIRLAPVDLGAYATRIEPHLRAFSVRNVRSAFVHRIESVARRKTAAARDARHA